LPRRTASRSRRRRRGPTCAGCCKKAGIDKKISPHKLRHTYATNLLNTGAELVDIKALLGHESIATTQIYTNVGQERMERVVGRL
jgi:site-specific recombinase XerD